MNPPASSDALPASAPPPWGDHAEVAAATVAPLDADDHTAAPPQRRRARFMRGMVALGLALGGLILLAMRVRRRTR